MNFDDFERKVKETAQNVAQKAKDAAVVVGKKTNDIIEEGKINSKIKEINNNMQECYIKLGKLAYEGNGIIEDTAAAAAICEEIDIHKRNTDKLKREIAKIKGDIYCAYCDTYNQSQSKYCSNCGETLEAEETACNE